jgi:hypothetical protein
MSSIGLTAPSKEPCLTYVESVLSELRQLFTEPWVLEISQPSGAAKLNSDMQHIGPIILRSVQYGTVRTAIWWLSDPSFNCSAL